MRTDANVVTVVANDFAFEAPAEVPAGLTKFVLKHATPYPTGVVGLHYALRP